VRGYDVVFECVRLRSSEYDYQAPKEGKARDTSANTVVDQWQTTKEDFLQFLTDSLVVYEAFEVALQKPELQLLRNRCTLFGGKA